DAARPDARSLRLWRHGPSLRTGRSRRRDGTSSPETDANGLTPADLDQRFTLDRHLRVLARDRAVHTHALLGDELSRLSLALREGGYDQVHDMHVLLTVHRHVNGRDRIGCRTLLVHAVEFALRLVCRGRRVKLGRDGAGELPFRLARVQLFAGERVARGADLFHRQLGRPLVVVGPGLGVDGLAFSVALARRFP